MSQTAARQAPRPEPPRLFLVTRHAGSYSSFLERLADIYHLYPYGRAGLSGIVRSESERAAFVLSIVFCYDLLAWSMIWNAVFRRGQMALGMETLFAVPIGALFALIVFNFEQGFIASDWSVRGSRQQMKLAMATVLRIAAIGASAWATAQPLELLVFEKDIQERVHQERVWEEIAVQALEFQRLEEEQAGGGEMKQPLVAVKSSEDDVRRVNEEEAAIQEELKRARSTKESIQKSMPGLRKEAEQKRQNYLSIEQKGDPAEVQAARRAMVKAQDLVHRAEGRLTSMTEQVENKEIVAAKSHSDVVIAEKSLGEKTKDLKEQRLDVSRRLENLRNWVRRLSLSGPDQDTIVAPPELHTPDFDVRPYSFAEQRRVLDDLRFGRPIQRHNLTLVNPKLLSDELKLQDQRIADQASKDDRNSSALVITSLYWSLFIVALFIPAMGLFFKLIIHARLGDYYSEEYQAASGHPEAMQAVQTDQFLKRRRDESKRDAGDKYRDGHIL